MDNIARGLAIQGKKAATSALEVMVIMANQQALAARSMIDRMDAAISGLPPDEQTRLRELLHEGL